MYFLDSSHVYKQPWPEYWCQTTGWRTCSSPVHRLPFYFHLSSFQCDFSVLIAELPAYDWPNIRCLLSKLVYSSPSAKVLSLISGTSLAFSQGHALEFYTPPLHVVFGGSYNLSPLYWLRIPFTFGCVILGIDKSHPTQEVDWGFEGQGYQGLKDVYVGRISRLLASPLIVF